MTTAAKKTKPAKPDANGWTKGAPASEGPMWFLAKDKHGKWRLYLGQTFLIDGVYYSDLQGWGLARPEEAKAMYYKPAELPDLPVALMRRGQEPALGNG